MIGKTKLKVSKSRKQIMKSRILPKNERITLRIVSWVCFVRFLPKGQWISKANYDVFDSSKKRTNHTQDSIDFSRFTDL